MGELSLQSERLGTSAVMIRCAGELDSGNFETLDDEPQDTIESGTVRVIVDLSQVSYMSSAGIGVLVGANADLGDQDGILVLMAPSEAVATVLETMGFLAILNVVPTEEAALHKLGIATGTGRQTTRIKRFE